MLSRYVSHMPTGIGLAHPTTMQLAIDEAGAPRILLAAAAAAVTKPLGMRGVFYRIAGNGVNAIDGPSSLNLPPYDKWATKSPVDPSGEALRIAADLRSAPAAGSGSPSSMPTTWPPRCSRRWGSTPHQFWP